MANIKISGLTAAASVADANEFEINEAGTSKKVTGAQISSKVIADIGTEDIRGTGALMDDELTSIADVKALNQGVGTGDSPQFTGVNVGHATDTTITRTGAGVIAVEGVEVTTNTATQTLTNKTLTSPTINVTSDATGDVYYRSAGGAFTRLAAGTDGHVLTLASGIPSWAAGGAGGSGSYTFISSSDISAAATWDFTATDAASYDAYEVHLMNVIPATDATMLRMRTSTDGGSTYDSTSGHYGHTNYFTGENAGTPAIENQHTVDSGETTYLAITSPDGGTNADVGSGANEHGVSGVIRIHGPHLTKYTMITAHVGYISAAGEIAQAMMAGVRNSAADVDAWQLYFNSGNIESGTINVYGLANA